MGYLKEIAIQNRNAAMEEGGGRSERSEIAEERFFQTMYSDLNLPSLERLFQENSQTNLHSFYEIYEMIVYAFNSGVEEGRRQVKEEIELSSSPSRQS